MRITIREFQKLYGKATVYLLSYYKFTFTFKGEYDGKVIYVSVGGNADSIYELEFVTGAEELVENLDVNSASVYENEKLIYICG